MNRMDTGDGHRFSLLDKKPVYAILLIFKQVKHQYSLQYFSYHHHYNNEHYISKFWQVRNLRLPFHLVCCLKGFKHLYLSYNFVIMAPPLGTEWLSFIWAHCPMNPPVLTHLFWFDSQQATRINWFFVQICAFFIVVYHPILIMTQPHSALVRIYGVPRQKRQSRWGDIGIINKYIVKWRKFSSGRKYDSLFGVGYFTG